MKVSAFGVQIVQSLRAAQAAVADIGRHAEAFGSGPRGVVKIATMPMLGADFLVPALPQFYKTFPGIRVDLSLHYAVANLARGDADIAIRTARPTQQNLIMKRLASEPLRAWASGELLARGGSPDALPWIGWPQALDLMEQWLGSALSERNVVLRVDDAHAQARACEAGLGVAVLTESAAALYEELHPVPGIGDGPTSPLWIVRPDSLVGVPRVDAVWDWIIAAFDR